MFFSYKEYLTYNTLTNLSLSLRESFFCLYVYTFHVFILKKSCILYFISHTFAQINK